MQVTNISCTPEVLQPSTHSNNTDTSNTKEGPADSFTASKDNINDDFSASQGGNKSFISLREKLMSGECVIKYSEPERLSVKTGGNTADVSIHGGWEENGRGDGNADLHSSALKRRGNSSLQKATMILKDSKLEPSTFGEQVQLMSTQVADSEYSTWPPSQQDDSSEHYSATGIKGRQDADGSKPDSPLNQVTESTLSGSRASPINSDGLLDSNLFPGIQADTKGLPQQPEERVQGRLPPSSPEASLAKGWEDGAETQSTDIPLDEGLINDPIFYRPCKPAISTCSDSWLQKTDKPQSDCIKEACENPSINHYVYSMRRPHPVYRNEFCAMCNGEEPASISCQQEAYMVNALNKGMVNANYDGSFFPISIVIDLNKGGRRSVESRVGFELEKSVEKILAELKQCPEHHVYNPYSHECEPLLCPDGEQYKNNGCFPLDNSPTNETEIENESSIDCLRIEVREYSMLDNMSLFINASESILDPGDYKLLTDGRVLICNEYQQIYNVTYSNMTQPLFILKFSQAQSILSAIGQIISIIGLFILLIVYSILPQLRNIPGKNVMCMSASLLLAQLLFLFGVGQTDVEPVCRVIAGVLHYSFLAAFYWMNIMSCDIWRTFSKQEVMSPTRKWRNFLFYSLYGWLSPALIVVLSITVNNSPNVNPAYRVAYAEDLCWINNRNALLVFFGIPIAVILLTNILFYCLTLRSLIEINKTTRVVHEKDENKQRYFLYIKLSVVMGLTWIFGFLATLTETEFLWYIFIILNSLQGAFICLSFVMTRKVWKLIREKWSKMGSHASIESDQTKSTALSTKRTSLSSVLNNRINHV